MGTIRLTMAQALVKFLDNQYVLHDGVERKFVKGVFGIFGHGNVTGMGEALENHIGEITYLQGKNEQGMVHTAAAFAKQKNRLEIYGCTTSIGPGALNMVAAAGTATANRIPVLLLPGDNFASRQPDPVLQQIENPMDYTISAADAFKPVSKYWDRVVRPEQLMTAMIHAMRVLTNPADTGAVTIALPQDVQAEAYDYPEEFFAKRVHYIERQEPFKNALQRAVELIKTKKNPVIIAGGGVHYSNAQEQLQKFAHAFTIPVGETQAGKSALPWDDALYMGSIGSTGSKASNILAREADLIIGVGTRFTDFTTSSKWAFGNPDVDFLSINVSDYDAVKLDATKLVGDAQVTLGQLQKALEAEGYQSAHDSGRLKELKAEWDAIVDDYYSQEVAGGLSQTRVIGEINNFVQPEDVIVCAAGSMPGDLHRLWRSSKPKSYHMEYGFSCMGYEVAGALGVKLAIGDEGEAYAFVGDGSYLMLHTEIVTSIQENKKMTILLLDNNGYQCIHNLQVGQGSEGFGNEFRYRSEQDNRLSGDYVQIDFAQNARSLGAKGYTVRTIEELHEALARAKEETVTTLIDIKVLPGTCTVGTESWWRLGVAEVSTSEKVSKAHEVMAVNVMQARKY
ncbi:3D-(3,5/4)-trihydroxycyclohexane-1,2-dione acylhydrolase (decyclizing) [Lysinibacillus sp. NPDC098008]|uniref:3D-(3,5/4)-trihydroxycyclohexane-1,2-dione acylhydrolase (decyclizing) n=1 Tax=Lysinibacillus sp. NPDC098008 TaxID=3364146 RepID=UPI00381AB91F